MKEQEIELLFNDLCERLPYGVKVTFAGYSEREDYILNLNSQHLNSTYAIEYLRLRPYLRPLSSMTEEERDEFNKLWDQEWGKAFDAALGEYSEYPLEVRRLEIMATYKVIDWLNAHHFDYRGLIDKGLAISTEEFNPYKKD